MFSVLLRSIFGAIISFFSFELIINHKNLFLWLAIFYFAASFFISFSIIQICRVKSHRFQYLMFPFLFNLSAFLFFIFIPGQVFQQIYIIIASLLFGLLLFYVGNFILGYAKTSLFLTHYSLFDILILSCGFLCYSGLFGLYLFLSWSLTTFLILIVIVSVFLLYCYFWYNQITCQNSLLYYFVFALIAAEVAWAMAFWSTGYLSRGVVLFVIFYVFSGLLKNYLHKTLSKRLIKEYLITVFLVLGLILGTTKWTY